MKRSASQDGGTRSRLPRWTVAFAAAAILSGCPNPIPISLGTQLADAEAPTIVITAPRDGDSYGPSVTVAGTVVDADGPPPLVKLLADAAGIDQQVEVAADGTFSFQFDTAGVSDALPIRIETRDWNGNTSEATITLVNDQIGPWIQITEPEDLSAYATVVRVSGTIANDSTSASHDDVVSASYSVLGSAIGAAVEPADDNSFSFEFKTVGESGETIVDGTVVIQLTAIDGNGNATVESVSIVKSETGDFDLFVAAPCDRGVVLSWTEVLHAESYTVHELMFGETRTDVTSPFTWNGLDNGQLYAFFVQGNLPTESGADAVSQTLVAMPLSHSTLAPSVSASGYRSITIEWAAGGSDLSYDVQRSVSATGPWGIRRRLSETQFTDTGLEHDTTYWYRVVPSTYRDIASTPVSGVPAGFAYAATSVAETWACADVAVEGDLAYLARGSRGIAIADTSEISALAIIDQVSTTGAAMDLAVAGSYLCVAAGDAGLLLFDRSDPHNSDLYAAVPTGGTAYGVAVSGDYAFVAAGSDGLAIVNIADRLNPSAPIFVDTPGSARDVEIVGSTAYIADGQDGLCIVDVETPEAPGPAYSEATPGYAYDLAVSGEYTYVADLSGGVAILDVSEKDDPTYETSVTTPRSVRGIVIDDDRAFLCTEVDGLMIVDISTPTSPGDPRPTQSYWSAAAAQIVGDHALVATQAGLAAISVARPSASGPTTSRNPGGISSRLTVDGSRLYVAAGTAGVASLSIDDPLDLDPADLTDTDGHVVDVHARGDYVYSAVDIGGGASGGLVITVKPELQAVGPPVYVDPTVSARGLDLRGEFAFLAAVDRLCIYDVSDVANVGHVATRSVPGPAIDVAVSGTHAYVAGSTALYIADITDPYAPGTWSEAVTPGDANAVVVADDHAYIADGGAGLSIVDVTDPNAPGAAVTKGTGGYAYDVAVSGSWAFVACGSAGLAMIDISDPDNPAAPRFVSTVGDATGVLVRGTHVFVGCDTAGVMSISIPPEA